jgi:RimJ/RimL family protein N-acetyltransferase
MEPLLVDVPEPIRTPRLVLRSPLAGDGSAVNAAIQETIESLQRWMPWSRPAPTVEQTELWCRKVQAEFLARTNLALAMFRREPDGTPGEFVGNTGFHAIDWAVPRFEIGYWARRRFEGQGYVTEAVRALAAFAFDTLHAERVEIRMDDRNERSWRVAERAGFRLEGVLRRDSRDPDGGVRDTRVYARVRGDP